MATLDPGRSGRTGLALHVTQLALNAAWPYLFFTVRNRTTALAFIAALDNAIAAEIAAAARHDRTAAALLAPYLAWSLCATALTAAINPNNSDDKPPKPTEASTHQ